MCIVIIARYFFGTEIYPAMWINAIITVKSKDKDDFPHDDKVVSMSNCVHDWLHNLHANYNFHQMHE